MKTLSKKLLTACLALMVAVVMAVPAFAADNSNTLIERDYTPIFLMRNSAIGLLPMQKTMALNQTFLLRWNICSKYRISQAENWYPLHPMQLAKT